MSALFQHPSFWFGLATVLLLAANLFVFLTRNWEESLFPTDYARLHYPLDRPTLRRWKLKRDGLLHLDLAWNKVPESWQLLVDGKLVETIPGTTPLIRLAGAKFLGEAGTTLTDFEHRYTLRPLPAGFGPDLDFTIAAISADYYRRNGMYFPKDVMLVQTELPAGKFKRHPVSYWVDDYRYVRAECLAAADRTVREEIGVLDSDDTLTRMEKVMHYLRTQLATSGGVPKDAFRWLDPWNIFREMSQGTGKGWCTQSAQIFTFFANRAGIPTRFVFDQFIEDNAINYNGHSWAECWMKEHDRWTHVDPSHAIVAVFDRHGVPMNSADIMHLREHDAFEGVTARIFKDWHWTALDVAGQPRVAITVPFAKVNVLARTHLNRQAIIKYRRPPNVEDVRDRYSMLLKSPTFAWENFLRYYFKPTLAYSRLPTEGVNTYFKRLVLLFSTVVMLGAWIAF